MLRATVSFHFQSSDLIMPRARRQSDAKPPRPTDSEVSILAVLWERGPSTVRQVFEVMSSRQEVGYTTVLKFMQIMTDKGLLERDTSIRPQIFRPAETQAKVQGDLVGDLLDRVFGGSTESLVLRALANRRSDPQELEAIRRYLDEIDGGGR